MPGHTGVDYILDQDLYLVKWQWQTYSIAVYSIVQQYSCWTYYFFLNVSPASESESNVSPKKRARVGEAAKDTEASSSSLSFLSTSSASSSSRSGSKQRNRKRCHHCQTKLELVQQELGSCRCGKSMFTILMWAHTKLSAKKTYKRAGRDFCFAMS